MACGERYVGAGQLVLQRRHGQVHGQRGTAQASHRLALPAKRRRGLFAHQHDQQRVVAAVLLKRVPGCMDQVVQRRIHMALAQLAGPLVQQTHAGDEFGARIGVAQRHVEQRTQAFPLVGHAGVGRRHRRACVVRQPCLGDGLQWRIAAQHHAHGGPELAPPFEGLVLVGKQHLRAQMRQLRGAGDVRTGGQQQPPAGLAHAEGQRRVLAQVVRREGNQLQAVVSWR